MKTTRNPAAGQESPCSLSGFINRNAPALRAGPAAMGILAALLAFGAGPLRAADTYDASLKAGDEHRGSKDYDAALADYDVAFNLSDNSGMKALALGKKGAIYVDQKNYAAARQAADEALGLKGTAPVARVIALQVLAECQIKDEKDYAGAIETLGQALQLEGVSWAEPPLNLLLGDSYRFSGKFEQALEAYGRIAKLPSAPSGIKAIAFLNIGITDQYNLRDEAQAKAAYKKAVELNPALQSEVDDHLSRIP